MSLQYARDAIRARLEAGGLGVTLVFENEHFNQEEQRTPWLWCEVIGGTNRLRGIGKIGERLFVHPGVIMLHAYTDIGQGTGPTGALTGAAAAQFERVEFSTGLANSLVRTEDPSEAGPGAENGRWYRASVSIPFDFYYQR